METTLVSLRFPPLVQKPLGFLQLRPQDGRYRWLRRGYCFVLPAGPRDLPETLDALHRLRQLAAYHAGEISYAEFDASIQGWINHVRHADSWGLRRHVLETLAIRPAEHRRAVEAR